MKGPTNKKEMFQLYLQGKFGYSPKIWNTKDEMIADKYSGLIGLRYAGFSGGGLFKTMMTLSEAELTFHKWISDGADKSRIIWCEAIDNKKLAIQGEVQRDVGGLSLTYTDEKGTINRPATWKNKKIAFGAQAVAILWHYMSGTSYDTLMELLDIYPNSVVEFSVLERGLEGSHNTVFWEVREY